MTNTAKPTHCTDCDTKLTSSNRASSHGLGSDFDGMCIKCYDYAGWENTHQDEGHDAEGALPDPNCPVCMNAQPTLRTGHHEGGAKGVHINHAACYAKDLHTKDRDGRQLCRDTELWVKANNII